VPADVEAAIAALAARQHGHATRAQLLALGLKPDAIKYRARTDRLIRVHAGVYAVGHRPASLVARAAAAVLACGPGAVLSHGSAASLWGIDKRWATPFEVSAPTPRKRPGITTHRVTTLARADIRIHLGVRVTSPARTLLDVASRLTDAGLTRAVNDLRLAGDLKTAQLAAVIDRATTHAGAPRLRAIVHDSAAAPTRSSFEDEFRSFAQRFGLPAPEINVRIAGREVDALFRAERVIVELDGYRYHGGRESFERDRERDAASLEQGYATVRITWKRLGAGSVQEARRLERILRARRH
jgi:Transcriptional regulator, AbiEi antitoxin/AbiEi antitoxin C-terminal domain